MSVNAVLSSPRKNGTLTPLERLVQARKAVYINRFRAMSNSCGQLQVERHTPAPMTTQAAEMAIEAEFAVVCDFLQQSGIVESCAGDARIVCVRNGSRKCEDL
ncbi:hypothetical protein AAVH_06659 [Aphelenchoides avenae]|nr:hypothetical protein AAVH_06659 [Aphelenchus avenae]